jgi:exopolysaccharide production protein ExoQ
MNTPHSISQSQRISPYGIAVNAIKSKLEVDHRVGADAVNGVVDVPWSAVRMLELELPVYQYVATWLMLFPLLLMVAQGSLSFLGVVRDANFYQHSVATTPAQGIRGSFVIYVVISVAFILAGNRILWRVLVKNPLILGGILLAAVSALWSESPLITLRASAEVMLATLFACYLSAKMPTERLMRLLMFVGVVAGVLSTALALALPQYGIFQGYGGGAWEGICSHKNTLGLSMAFLLTPVFFVTKPIGQKVMYVAFLLFLIMMSQSRSAWLITAGMLAFVGWLSLFRKLRSQESLLLTISTGIAVLALIVLGISYVGPLMGLLGKDPTLTGRTGIYAIVWESILKHPFLGYGFNAFWQGKNSESLNVSTAINWPGIGYAENGILDLALQIGFVGVGLVLLMLGRAIRQASVMICSPFYNPRVGWFITIIVLQLFINIDAGWLMAAPQLDWSLTLIACIGLANEARIMDGRLNEANTRI